MQPDRTPSAATPSGLAIRPSVLALVRKRRDALEAAGATPTQAYVIALEERLLDEHDDNQRLWDQQPEATVTNLGGEQRLGGGDRDGSAASTGERLAQNLYAAMVEESMLGGAVQRQLEQDGLDTRELLPIEPPGDFYAD
jgi:hypothetical protein